VVVKRETGSWKQMWIMGGYLFGLAYLASLITYHLTNVLTAL
jgi:ferrous iron transport protein B